MVDALCGFTDGCGLPEHHPGVRSSRREESQPTQRRRVVRPCLNVSATCSHCAICNPFAWSDHISRVWLCCNRRTPAMQQDGTVTLYIAVTSLFDGQMLAGVMSFFLTGNDADAKTYSRRVAVFRDAADCAELTKRLNAQAHWSEFGSIAKPSNALSMVAAPALRRATPSPNWSSSA